MSDSTNFKFELAHSRDAWMFTRTFNALLSEPNFRTFWILDPDSHRIGMFAWSTNYVNEKKVASCHCRVFVGSRSVRNLFGVIWLLGIRFVDLAKKNGYDSIVANCPAEEKAVAKLFKACGMITTDITLGQIFL